jgi:hypothetical protein
MYELYVILAHLHFHPAQVARESVKEVVFDVGHLDMVKERLRGLLRSEIVPVAEMCHQGETNEKSMEDEGTISIVCCKCTYVFVISLPSLVACNVGDWVQVECDYSPGICSEGGTAVVIAKVEG